LRTSTSPALQETLRSLDSHLELRCEQGEDVVVCKLCGPKGPVMEVRH
jgi:hypothetical protein